MKDPIERADAIQEMMDEDVDHVQGKSGREVIQILMDMEPAQPVDKDIDVPSNDCISREDTLDVFAVGRELLRRALDDADVVGVERAKYEWGLGLIESYIAAVKDLPAAQPQRKTGRWTEKHHTYADEEKVIEEWQSCKCSVCGRYDTRPYLYYFKEPNFCSWCGADMRGGEQDE